MRTLTPRRVLALVVLALLTAGPAAAQDKGIVIAAGWAPQWLSANDSSATVPLGVMFNVAATVMPRVQIVGDLGYSHKDSASLTTFTAGVRYVIPQAGGKATPFLEGLIGGGHFESVTAIAFGAGGGVDVKAWRGGSFRFQLNYFQLRKYGQSLNEVRFGIGLATASNF